MIKIFYRYIILSVFFLCSCSNEEDTLNNDTGLVIPEGSVGLNFAIVTDSVMHSSISSYATEMGNDAENKIKNLRFVFTQLDGTTIVKTVDISSVPSPTINVYNVTLVLTQAEASTAKSVWVIANYDGNPSHDISFNSYYTTAISSEPNIPNVSTPSSYIPMTGSLVNHDFENAPNYTVYMKRTMAKLRIHAIKGAVCDPNLEIHWDEIKCTIINATSKTALWGTNPRDMSTTSGVLFFNYIHNSQRREPGFDSHTSTSPSHTIIDSCYLNENYRANISGFNDNNRTMLRITIPSTLHSGIYAYPKKEDVYEVPINTSGGYNINRNTIYDLTMQIVGQSEFPTIYATISDWNGTEIKHHVSGSQLLSATKKSLTINFNPFISPTVLEGDTLFAYLNSDEEMSYIFSNTLYPNALEYQVDYLNATHSAMRIIVKPGSDFFHTSSATLTLTRKNGLLIDYIYVRVNQPLINIGISKPGLQDSRKTWSSAMGYTLKSDSTDTSIVPPLYNGLGCGAYGTSIGQYRVPDKSDAIIIFNNMSKFYLGITKFWLKEEGDTEDNNKDTYALVRTNVAPGYTAQKKTNTYYIDLYCINSDWKITK